MEPIKIMLVDSEEIFLEGLAKVLRRRFQTDAISCVRSISQMEGGNDDGVKPDVVILGKDNSSGNSVYDCIRKAQELHPAAKLAVILSPDTEEDPVEILKSGALACIARSIEADDFIACMQLIIAGRIIISHHFARKFLNGIARRQEEELQKEILTSREIEISKLIAQGKTNREISQAIFVTESTVKVHVRNILNKLKCKNRQQIVAFAIFKKWLVQATVA